MGEPREEWSPWVDHDGTDCPLPDGVFVEMMLANGELRAGIVAHATSLGLNCCNCWIWEDCAFFGIPDYRVLRYRLRKPRALIALREMAESLSEGVDA